MHSLKTSNTLSPLSQEHKKRADLFSRFWKYYGGQHHKNLKVRPNQPDDNVTLNYSKKVVNLGVDFLAGKPPMFVAEGDAAQTYLDAFWDDDPISDFGKADIVQSVALSGGVTGTPFIRLYPDGRGDFPRLVVLDSSMLNVVTNPDDKDDIQEYHIIWKSGKDWQRHRIERDQSREFWIINEEVYRSGWKLINEPIEWPYRWSPIFHCQNLKNPRDFWGFSDLTDADLNDAVNFTASNTNRILHIHAHPRTVGFGFQASALQATAVDKMWTVPDANARVENLEMQSDLGSSRQHLADLKQDFHQVTGTPNLDPATVNVGALSGFALRVLYGPLLKKTQGKQQRYGAMLSRLNWAILELANIKPEVVQNRWGSALPENAKERVELFTAYVNGGASVYAAAIQSGHTEEEAQLLSQADIVDGITRSGMPADVEDAAANPEMNGLNGAQIRAILDVLANVKTGSTPPSVAQELIAAVGIPMERAQRIVGELRVDNQQIVTAG